MAQAVAAYLIVAVAAAWTAWSLFLRGWLRRRSAERGASSCGPDCACGD